VGKRSSGLSAELGYRVICRAWLKVRVDFLGIEVKKKPAAHQQCKQYFGIVSRRR